MGRDRIIEAYIQRLLAWETPVTQVTLTSVAEEVGLTHEELEAITTQAQTHLTRGRAYIEFGCLDDALNELSQAATLAPLDLEILHLLANTYNLRHNRTSNLADRQNALMVAKRCVDLKPDDKEALVLISFLEHSSNKRNQKVPKWPQKKIALLTGGLATIGFGLMGLSRLSIFSPSLTPLGPAPGTVVPGSAIYSQGNDQAAADIISRPRINFLADVDIPVVFDYPDLVVEARLSELGDYENEVYYQLKGIFINASDQEFGKLTLNVEFLDRDGTVLVATEKEAIAASDAVIRPGDTHTFNLLQKITSDLATVRLNVTHLEQAPARNTYVPPTPINYGWEGLEPTDISFELASRSEALNQSAPLIKPDDVEVKEPAGQASNQTNKPDDKQPSGQSNAQATLGKFNAEWVIINTSQSPIRKLKLKADFYDRNERLLQSKEVLVIQNNDAPLLMGETRPFRVLEPMVERYERYRVTVLEVE